MFLEDWLSILVIALAAAICILAAVYAFRKHMGGRSKIHLILGAAALLLLLDYLLYLVDYLRMDTGGGFWLIAGIILLLAAALAEIIVDL